MLNILWVEDNFSQEKQDIWFNGRFPDVKTDFVTALKAIHNNLNQYDLVILDIDLENTPHNEQVIAFANYFGKTEREFLQEGGMFLFLQLIEKGFSRERIIFLTGNADENISRVDELRKASEQDDDALFNEIFAEIQKGLNESKRKELHPFIENDDIENLCSELEKYYNSLHQQEEKNTYNRFCDSFKKAFVEPPKEINKGLNVTKRLNEWLEGHEKNDYLVLRRGIIEACQHLKTLPEDKLRFNTFIKDDEKQVNLADMHDYLGILENFLPLREPTDKAALYKLFIRTLTHEWEAAIPNKSTGLQELFAFASIMKIARNWIAHSGIFNNVNEQDVAFLFICNMRAMFELSNDLLIYEDNLLNLFKNPLDASVFNKKIGKIPQDRDLPLSKGYIALLEEAGKIYGTKTWETNFYDVLKNLQQDKSNNKSSDFFIEKLYQCFWFLTSTGYIYTPKMEYQFFHFKYGQTNFLLEFSRHICNRSFSQD